MSDSIDWRGIAEKLGTITQTKSGWTELGGTKVGCDAIIDIFGDAVFRDAVDFYISCQPGYEVARSVLMLLRPPAAMERCREIFRSPANEQQAADAINLLKMVADRRVFEWIPEFMQSANEGVKVWTLGIIDQLMITQECVTAEEAMPFFKQALADPSENVKQQAKQFLETFGENEEVAKLQRLLQ